MGIDVGTTFTAAATGRRGRVDICALGTHGAVIPTVVLLREDGSRLFGESADRRAVTEPTRVARQFKRRFGDSTPLLLGGTPCSPEMLTAWLISHVMSEVGRRQGEPPGALCITHPANWGPFKTDLLRQTVRLAGVTCPVTYVSEPVAAAMNFRQAQRLDPGKRLAVYDLGGGTFDAAVLESTETGFELLGNPEGIERLGGIDVDAAVFQHVADVLGDSLGDLDEDEPSLVAAMSRLRQECTAAKEALSADTDVTIPVLLPDLTTEVRLTRAELEEKLRPALHGSVEALSRALVSASVDAAQLEAILLVGGSSRMPLIAQLVTAEFGRPVVVDEHPKHGVALGAAWLACAAVAEGHGEPKPTADVVSKPVPDVVTKPGPEVVTKPAPDTTATPVPHATATAEQVAPPVSEAREQVPPAPGEGGSEASALPLAPVVGAPGATAADLTMIQPPSVAGTGDVVAGAPVPRQGIVPAGDGGGEPGRPVAVRRLAVAGAAVLATGVVGALLTALLTNGGPGPVTVPSQPDSATAPSASSTSAVGADVTPPPTNAPAQAGGGQPRPGGGRAPATARPTRTTTTAASRTPTSTSAAPTTTLSVTVTVEQPAPTQSEPISPPRGAPWP